MKEIFFVLLVVHLPAIVRAESSKTPSGPVGFFRGSELYVGQSSTTLTEYGSTANFDYRSNNDFTLGTILKAGFAANNFQFSALLDFSWTGMGMEPSSSAGTFRPGYSVERWGALAGGSLSYKVLGRMIFRLDYYPWHWNEVSWSTEGHYNPFSRSSIWLGNGYAVGGGWIESPAKPIVFLLIRRLFVNRAGMNEVAQDLPSSTYSVIDRTEFFISLSREY